MRLVRVREVIALAAGLSGVTPGQVLRPTDGLTGSTQSRARAAAILVAHLHCGRSVAFLAGHFCIPAEWFAGALQAVTEGQWHPAFEEQVEALNRAVLNLKASRRRLLEMRRWRAVQNPPEIHRGKYQRPPIKRGPREWNPPKSSWIVETSAPVGAEHHAA